MWKASSSSRVAAYPLKGRKKSFSSPTAKAIRAGKRTEGKARRPIREAKREGGYTSATFPHYADLVDASGTRFVASPRNGARLAGKKTFWLEFLLPVSTPLSERLDKKYPPGAHLWLSVHGDSIGLDRSVVIVGYNIAEPRQKPRYGQVEVMGLDSNFQDLFMRRMRQGHV